MHKHSRYRENWDKIAWQHWKRCRTCRRGLSNFIVMHQHLLNDKEDVLTKFRHSSFIIADATGENRYEKSGITEGCLSHRKQILQDIFSGSGSPRGRLGTCRISLWSVHIFGHSSTLKNGKIATLTISGSVGYAKLEMKFGVLVLLAKGYYVTHFRLEYYISNVAREVQSS